MDIVAQLGTLLGLSFISGVNLYATVAVVGICVKFQLVQGLPPEFQPLARDPVILVALFLYSLEFLADKVPGLDTLWDSVHTLIRPFGGAMLALMQVGDASPALQVVVFMLGASLASLSHLTKAGTRLIVNTSPEPFSNAVVSIGEDVGAVGLSYLSLSHPRFSFFITVGLVLLIVLLLPVLFRAVKMMVLALADRLKSLAGPGGPLRPSLPLAFDEIFDRQKEGGESLLWAGKAYAANVPGLPRFAPLQVAVTDRGVHFLYRRRLRSQGHRMALSDLDKDRIYPGMLLSKWLLRTPAKECLIYLYPSLSKTAPRHSSP